MKWPFRRSQKLSIEGILKRQSRLSKDVSTLRRQLTMEDEIYCKDSKTRELSEESIFNRIPH